MKTPQQVINEAREEFEKRFCVKGEDSFFDIELSRTDDCISARKPLPSEIFSFHTSTLQAFIEAEIARLEGMKKVPPNPNFGTSGAYNEANGYNQAIDDQISHYKELLLTNHSYPLKGGEKNNGNI